MVCIPVKLRQFVSTAFLVAGGLGSSAIPPPRASRRDLQQRDALIIFYDATGGDDWTNNSNSEWLSDTESFCEWYNQADPEDVCENGILRELILEDNNLVGTLPVEISQLTGLVELDLEANYLEGSIPSTISQLVNLVELDLSDNLLKGDLGDIDWTGMVQLVVLSLHSNQLSGEIPSELPESLGEISLYFNNVTGTLPEGIFGLPNLEEFDVEFNLLSGTIPTGM